MLRDLPGIGMPACGVEIGDKLSGAWPDPCDSMACTGAGQSMRASQSAELTYCTDKLSEPGRQMREVMMRLWIGCVICAAVLPAGLVSAQPESARQYKYAEGLIFAYDLSDERLAADLWPVMKADRQEIMDRLELHPPGTLRVVLAPDLGAFRRAQPAPAPENALGLYYPSTRTVLLRSPRTLPGGDWDLRGVMRHELAHGVLDLAISQPIPRWLNEGLAILVADELSFLDDSQLTLAAVRDRLIPLDLLMTGFPRTSGGMTLAYSQAASFARFLLRLSGMAGIKSVLRAMAAGSTVQGAFAAVYTRSLSDLERDWHGDLSGRFSWMALVTSATILGGIGTPLLIAGAMRRWVLRRCKYREWDEEDNRIASGLTAPKPTRASKPRWLN